MPIEFAEDLLENDDFKVQTDGNGDLIQEHKQTGATFKFDSTKNRWIPVQGIDLENANLDNANFGTNVDAQGNDINNIGAVNTDDADIGQLVSTLGLNAQDLTVIGKSIIVNKNSQDPLLVLREDNGNNRGLVQNAPEPSDRAIDEDGFNNSVQIAIDTSASNLVFYAQDANGNTKTATLSIS